jgi:hypothetical protein
MRFFRSRLAWLVPVVVLVAGIAAAQTAAPGQPAAPPASVAIPRSLDIPDGALVAAGKAPEVELLYTGDVIGYIEPCG